MSDLFYLYPQQNGTPTLVMNASSSSLTDSVSSNTSQAHRPAAKHKKRQ